MTNQARAILIHDHDSVAVAIEALEPGEQVALGGELVSVREAIPTGHKLARRAHAPGEPLVKYGFPIGLASARIEPGQHVHSHNLATALGAELELGYRPSPTSPPSAGVPGFSGFRRADGRAATRNELWIVPTVGCVARTAEQLAAAFRRRLGEFPNVEDVVAFAHAFGCSQLGDDLTRTQRILSGLCTHPNAGGVLVLGLGCESNHLGAFRPFLGEFDPRRVRFLSAQASPDEFEEGLGALAELAAFANQAEREALSASELVLGLKCGGSDGLSGITANPLVGRFAARLVASGGKAILTEVPEMFGAERALFGRCVDAQVFGRALDLVRGFRNYFAARGQPVYENPSPGNRDGGITTLEEKSLGCVQKGGDAPITDVIAYGAQVRVPGLTLLEAPGNDPVSTTALCAAGATLVLFTTGRGTPLGSPVPTVKVATNSNLARRKPGWIDFDAGQLLEGAERSGIDAGFEQLVLSVASGARTKNELYGQRDIAIFKDGVTL